MEPIGVETRCFASLHGIQKHDGMGGPSGGVPICELEDLAVGCYEDGWALPLFDVVRNEKVTIYESPLHPNQRRPL